MSDISTKVPELKEIHIHNPKNKIKESTGYKVFTVFNTIIMIVVSLLTLFPFLYLILQSFTSDHAIIAGELSIQAFLEGKLTFEDFSINTYIYVITRNDCEFLKYYGNTIFYTIVGTILSLFFSAILAYPLSKPKLRINKILSPFIIFTMYFGGGLMANYVLMLKLGLKNSMWGFILPMLISTYYVILMRSFFMSIPKDLEEAGEIDGLNKWGVFRHIAIPLSTPIIATMTLFYAVMYWNNWFNAKLYLQDKTKWPVAYFLQTIIRGAGASDPDAQNMSANIKSCAMVLTVLPIICIYPFIQKYYVQGMMLGGVKE
ncbi:carbohydrate ABC transporter membrane protein 2 (CUT1 family) [Ruminococcaceae bacterium R-25]|nr:carbohydrate ABC transporter membrane protein 2 (CUT1 family) [Ruminococcaceae bacterium R-25]SUQ11814.1 carbohydrate ABC transporter membrane protein 2, CUT1 family [Oscillospiraceae bacterium]